MTKTCIAILAAAVITLGGGAAFADKGATGEPVSEAEGKVGHPAAGKSGKERHETGEKHKGQYQQGGKDKAARHGEKGKAGAAQHRNGKGKANPSGAQPRKGGKQS